MENPAEGEIHLIGDITIDTWDNTWCVDLVKSPVSSDQVVCVWGGGVLSYFWSVTNVSAGLQQLKLVSITFGLGVGLG